MTKLYSLRFLARAPIIKTKVVMGHYIVIKAYTNLGITNDFFKNILVYLKH